MSAANHVANLAPAIVAQGVCKTFRTWASPAQRLIAPLLHRAGNLAIGRAPGLASRLHQEARKRMHVHEALHDVSFEL